MVEIPEQLKNDDYRFVLLKYKNKIPFENNWQQNGYKYDDPKLIKHLEEGNNYGVIGGFGNIRMIDIDIPERVEEIRTKLGKTFTVRTGSGGRHFYIRCDYNTNHVLTGGLGEYRANNYQVVGASCIHPNGNSYEIDDSAKVKYFSREDIEEILQPYLRKNPTINKDPTPVFENIKDETRSAKEFGTVCKMIKEGKSDREIMSQMMIYAKWAGAPQQYRDLTIAKAREAVQREQLQNAADDEDELLLKPDNLTQLRHVVKGYIAEGKESKSYAIQALVQYALDFIPCRTIQNDAVQSVYFYNKKKGIWEENGISKIKTYLEDVLGLNYNLPFAATVIERIKINTYITDEEFYTIKSPHKIPCANGLLNLLDETIEDFDPLEYHLTCVPLVFDPDAKCPKIEKFINTTFRGLDKDAFYQLAGYLLYRGMPIHKFAVLVGQGENGKGQAIKLLQEFVHKKNVCAVSLKRLSTNQYAASAKKGKLLNSPGEISGIKILDTSEIKGQSGDDLIEVEAKYKAAETVPIFCKDVYAANELPEFEDNSIGMWRRPVLFSFSNRFVTQKEMDSLIACGEDVSNVYLKEADIVKKITTQEELSGFLNLALKGLKLLLKDGDFINFDTAQKMRVTYQRKSNTVVSFFEEIVDVSQGVQLEGDRKIEKTELYDAYMKYCSILGTSPRTDDSFYKYCHKEGGLIEERITTAGIRRRLYSEVFVFAVRKALNTVAESGQPGQPVQPFSYIVESISKKDLDNSVHVEERLDTLSTLATLKQILLMKPKDNATLIDDLFKEHVKHWLITNVLIENRAGTYSLLK